MTGDLDVDIAVPGTEGLKTGHRGSPRTGGRPASRPTEAPRHEGHRYEALALGRRTTRECARIVSPRIRRRHRRPQPSRRLPSSTSKSPPDGVATALRYWVTSALGLLRYRPALPALAKLAAEDVRVVNGLTRVCEEAKEAIALIRGRAPREDESPPPPART